ncbi:MAG: guanylate kinase [Bacteroidales bacterium]|nr:guanylate kinase [Bacteroidales bacterium]
MKKDRGKGKLIIVSAPSGSGKTSIVKYLLKHYPGLCFSISATSRAPREGEKHGVDYYFLSADEFRQKIDDNEFVEWEEVYENIYYGTLRSEIRRIWDMGRHIIFDVDVKGGLSLKNEFGERAISLFIKPPGIDELKQRLIKRGTDIPSEIEMRINKASEEMGEVVHFDKVIINDDLDKACMEALEICKRFLNDNG